MEDYLYLVAHLYTLRIHSFVLMPNHFHMIVTNPEVNLSAAMNYFMRETSREITRLSGRINQTYGNRHHKSALSTHHYFMNAYKYVYRNPVRAGLSKYVEGYVFSTLNGTLGLSRQAIPLCQDPVLFAPNFDDSTLAWLNKKPCLDQEAEVRKALRRATFNLVTNKNGSRSLLETELL
jgi:putative transposase